MNISNRVIYTPMGFEQVTGMDSSTGLTVPKGARYALLSAEAQGIRWSDASVPTTALGIVMAVADQPFWYAGNLNSLRFFEDTSGAILNVLYYS
jgi:hypothetical protein